MSAAGRLSRLLALAALLPALAGCVVVVAPPLSWFERDPGLRETVLEGEGDAKILVIAVDGFISDQPTERAFGLVREQSTLARVAAELDKAAQDPAIAAVVLRIDSPGGGVTASDEVYHRLRGFAEERDLPMVASLGGVAASGGYYVALAADDILAHPTTVTGSIGVILVGVNVAGLMDKLGVEDETYTSGPHKDLLSPLRGATEEERDIVQGGLDDLFARFGDVGETRRPGLSDTQRERAGVSEARVIMYHREGESAETVYSRFAGEPESGGGPAATLSGPTLSLESLTSPQFLYLWRPGLGGRR